MPNIVEIYLDDQLADYESAENLPLSLSKKTDKILEIIGADGVEIDNPLGAITLPGTKNNHSIYDQIAQLTQVPGALFVKDTKVLANGSLVFSGSSFLKSLSSGIFPNELNIEMVGDGLSIWTQLEGLSLRDLNLGVQTWSVANIETSWLASPTTGFPGIFAPVLYGRTSGEGTAGAWHQRDMRLSVYFYTILKGIFETYLGYSLVSSFFETLWFGRWAYAYSVGEAMQFENMPERRSVHVYRIPGVAGTFDPIEFHLEYEDTGSEWDEVGMTTFTADPVTTPFPINDYTLEFSGSGTNWGTFQIEVNGILVYSQGPSYTSGVSQYFEVTELLTLNAGDTVTVHAYDDGLGTMFIFNVHLRIYTTPQAWDGADIVVSSCLHDEPVKKFLRAVSQMFCLAWNVNNTTKQVFCEPRFPFRLYASGTYVQHDGFYQNPADPDTLEQISAVNYESSFEHPLGKELIMSYKTRENDPLFDAYQGANTNNGIPIFGVRKPSNSSDGKSIESENPMFSPLLLASPDANDATGGILPAILPDGYDINSEKIPSIDVTRKAPPTCGMVFQSALEAYWENSADFVSMPLLSQYKPYLVSGPHNDELNIGTFCDVTALPVEDGDVAQDCYGLVSTFYPQYFELMKPATIISLENPVSLESFASETFRELKMLKLGNGSNVVLAILVEIGGFEPANMGLIEMKFLQWKAATQAEYDDIEHNPIEIAPPVPNGLCCDASASVTKDTPLAGWAQIEVSYCRILFKGLDWLENVEVLVNNVRIYSGNLTPGTFGDADVTAGRLINISSSAIGTGVVTFTVNIKQLGCEVKQSVRVIEY